MARWPTVSERSGRFIVALLVCLKLMLLVWNASVYDGVTYQPERHAERAMFGGLKIGELSYDPPLYYLPALLQKRPAEVTLAPRSADEPSARSARSARKQAAKDEQAFRGDLLDLLRYTNVLWVGLFYLAWICFAFPRLLRDRQAWFLASLALLAMPGYQKLAAMSHPDNLFAAASALSVCAWLWLRERWQAATGTCVGDEPPAANGSAMRYLASVSLVIGLVGLTRPLALAYVAPLTLVALTYAARFSAGRWQQTLGRAVLVVTLVGTLSASWYVARWHKTGEVFASVPADVTAAAEPLRRDFSYAHYFLGFYPAQLWDNPNVSFGEAAAGTDARTAPVNSFFTLLHSEVWGDHWLSFSGAKQKEAKMWPKRISIATALLVPFITLALLFAWLWSFGKRSAKIWRAGGSTLTERLRSLGATLETELVLGAIGVLGATLFVWWQAGSALLPGDHSSLKFIHVAAFFPPAIALLLSRPLAKLPALMLAGYALTLFMAAFPVAMYYPR